MDAFSLDQWLVLLLAFLMGLFLGMAFLAGGKWKRRYREEAKRRETLEAENRQLRADFAQSETHHRTALTDPDRRTDDPRRPDVPPA